MKKVGIVYFKNSGNIGGDVQTLAMDDLVRRIQPEVLDIQKNIEGAVRTFLTSL